jgi:hypothetical protein
MKSQIESFLNYMDEALEDVKIDEDIDHITGPYNSTGVRRGTMPMKEKEEVKESNKMLPRHQTILKGPPERR